MREKLLTKCLEEKSGWDDKSWSEQDILFDMKNKIELKMPVDIANYALFLWCKSTQS